jgi:hypothetical protein
MGAFLFFLEEKIGDIPIFRDVSALSARTSPAREK